MRRWAPSREPGHIATEPLCVMSKSMSNRVNQLPMPSAEEDLEVAAQLHGRDRAGDRIGSPVRLADFDEAEPSPTDQYAHLRSMRSHISVRPPYPNPSRPGRSGFVIAPPHVRRVPGSDHRVRANIQTDGDLNVVRELHDDELAPCRLWWRTETQPPRAHDDPSANAQAFSQVRGGVPVTTTTSSHLCT